MINIENLRENDMRPNRRLFFLVVESSDETVAMYHAYLNRHMNAAVYRVSIEGLCSVNRSDFDCIIAEIPPCWSANDLFLFLRSRWPKIPIMLATGRSDHFIKDSLPYQNTAIISKPFYMEEMVELMGVLLELETIQDEKSPKTNIKRAD